MALPARYKWESAYPELWPDYGWCPSINPYGITTLYDRGGNCAHGTLNNFTLSTAWANPAVNGLVFDGTNDIVTVANVTKPTAAMTYVVWLYTTSTTTSQQALRGADALGGANYGFTLSLSGLTSGKYLFAIKTGSDNFLEATIPDTKLHCVIAKYDGATQSLRVDAAAAVTQSASGAVAYASVPLLIGGANSSSATLPFSGGIAGVLLYSRALSVGEELAHVALGPAGIYTPADRPVFGVSATTGNRRRRVIIGAA